MPRAVKKQNKKKTYTPQSLKHAGLIHSFSFLKQQQRTDQYGGSFENRTRFLFEVIAAVRAVIPESMPLFVRISSTEWMEHAGGESWDVESTLKLAKLLPAAGVDLLDVSSGGNNGGAKVKVHTYYQIDIAAKIRAAIKAENLKLLIGAVGFVTTSEIARSIAEEEPSKPAQADAVFVGRQFLKEPNWVQQVAGELDVPVKIAAQYHRATPRKRKEAAAKI
jgi:protein disulfide-isomerase A1